MGQSVVMIDNKRDNNTGIKAAIVQEKKEENRIFHLNKNIRNETERWKATKTQNRFTLSMSGSFQKFQ